MLLPRYHAPPPNNSDVCTYYRNVARQRLYFQNKMPSQKQRDSNNNDFEIHVPFSQRLFWGAIFVIFLQHFNLHEKK
jgi:hypothetical protein